LIAVDFAAFKLGNLQYFLSFLIFIMVVFAPAIQLIPDGTLFVHIAMILGMIFILNRTLFRPINKVLESRAKNTGGRSTEAQEILKQVADKENAYKTELRNVRTEGYEMLEDQRSQAVAERNEKISAVKTEVASMVEAEKSSVQNQFDITRKDLSNDAQKLAESISKNILKTA
jgi:F0F1-type ATP synthase membrane subunit b/b'